MNTAKTSNFHPPFTLRLANLLYDLMKGAIALFFMLLGIAVIILSWSASLYGQIEPFLQNNAIPLTLFGIALVVLGIGMLVLWYFNVRQRYYYLHLTPYTQVDRQVIRDTIETYWKQRFPEKNVSMRLNMKTKGIRLIAELPPCPIEHQRQTLEEIQQDLDHLFHQVLGYPHDVSVSLSFDQE